MNHAPTLRRRSGETSARAFYEERFRTGAYASKRSSRQERELRAFVNALPDGSRRTLEIGCGRGAYQDLVDDWTGVDVARSCAAYIRKPFVVASGTALPFADAAFDVIWTLNALEHIPEPERALSEMRRVVRSGGRIYLSPAWQVRPWAARGYAARAYRELDWRGRLAKLSIPIRDSVAFRGALLTPKRIVRQLGWAVRRRPTRFRYRALTPNYEVHWTSDSDACNSMDPHDAILWFVSRGDECLSHPTAMRALTVRTGGLAFRIRKLGG